jgi:hypothetical protein
MGSPSVKLGRVARIGHGVIVLQTLMRDTYFPFGRMPFFSPFKPCLNQVKHYHGCQWD